MAYSAAIDAIDDPQRHGDRQLADLRPRPGRGSPCIGGTTVSVEYPGRRRRQLRVRVPGRRAVAPAGLDRRRLSQWVGGHDFESATVFDLEAGERDHRHRLRGVGPRMRPDRRPGRSRRIDQRLRRVRATASAGASLHGDTLRIANLQPGPVYLRATSVVRTVALAAAVLRPPRFARRRRPDHDPAGGQIARVVAGPGAGRPDPRPPAGRAWACRPARVPMDGALRGRRLARARPQLLPVVHGIYDEVTGDYVINQVPDGTFKLRARTKERLDLVAPSAQLRRRRHRHRREPRRTSTGVDWQLLY